MAADQTALPWLERWSGPLDAVLALALTGIVLAGSVMEIYDATGNLGQPTTVPHPPVIAYVFIGLACAVLAWRRRWPVATFAFSLTVVVAYTALHYVDGAALLAPMLALYTLTVMGPVWRALAAAAITLVSLDLSNMLGSPFGAFGGPTVTVPFEVACALLCGLAVANRRAYVAEMRDRADRAERTREEEAHRRVDAERLRIARELHDVVAHTISVINVQARVAAQVIPDPPEAGAQALAAIKDASVHALREVRNILGVLRQPDSPAESPGGLDRLDALVSATTRAGLPVTVTRTGDPYGLPATVDLAAYRIVQESLTNALRHAGKARATVRVAYRPAEMTIEVVDDGRGIGDGEGPHGLGFGIAGMRERATAVGGTLDAGPRGGGGFRVRASLPVGSDK